MLMQMLDLKIIKVQYYYMDKFIVENLIILLFVYDKINSYVFIINKFVYMNEFV